MTTHNSDIADLGFLTIKDAASFLCVSRSTIYKLMEDGKLLYTTLSNGGRGRRIPKKALVDMALANLKGGWAK